MPVIILLLFSFLKLNPVITKTPAMIRNKPSNELSFNFSWRNKIAAINETNGADPRQAGALGGHRVLPRHVATKAPTVASVGRDDTVAEN